MRRFFVERKQIKDEEIEILGSDVNHITNVLRFKKGDMVLVCSDLVSYKGEIIETAKDRVLVKKIEKIEDNSETNAECTLYQGLAKGDKMDFIIQKNVELGIASIVPVIMERTIVRINEKDIEKKVKRWNRISMEAAKQCKRSVIPYIHPPITFEEFLARSKGQIRLMPFEKEDKKHIKSILKSLSRTEKLTFDILIGPEGGISAKEASLAVEKGFIPVSLGKRILRTETASIYASSCIAYEFESN